MAVGFLVAHFFKPTEEAVKVLLQGTDGKPQGKAKGEPTSIDQERSRLAAVKR